jgi:hypothetical protein
MSKVVQAPGGGEPELRALANRERKTRDKWLSFKKRLRAGKSLPPDCADEKFRLEEAKFDGAMKMIEERRRKLTTREVGKGQAPAQG